MPGTEQPDMSALSKKHGLPIKEINWPTLLGSSLKTNQQARLEDGNEDDYDEFEYDRDEDEVLDDWDEEYEEGMSG